MERFESVIDDVKDMGVLVYADPVENAHKLEIWAKRGDEEHLYRFIGPGVKMANIPILAKENEKLNEENKKLKEAYEKLMQDNTLNKESADTWEKEYYRLSIENEKLKKELHSLKTLKKSNLPETPITDTMLVDGYNRLVEENENLKKELSLEKDANEAQHKFILEYAGNGVEILFNYAIDEVKEVTYVIVDAEKYNKYREKWANAQSDQDEHKNTRADILEQAKKCVCGHREQDYGTPESNFQLIADLWNGYLGFTDNPQWKQIRATDVSMMMALMKIARIRNGGGSGDSFVDLAGYAACGGEIWHGERH